MVDGALLITYELSMEKLVFMWWKLCLPV